MEIVHFDDLAQSNNPADGGNYPYRCGFGYRLNPPSAVEWSDSGGILLFRLWAVWQA